MNCDSDDSKICDNVHLHPHVFHISIHINTCEPAMKDPECHYSGGFVAVGKKQEILKFLKNLSRMGHIEALFINLRPIMSILWPSNDLLLPPYFPAGPKCVIQWLMRLMFCIISIS